jgi:hypothetical protein
MKRLLLAMSVAAAALLALTAGTAQADPAIHAKFSFSVQFDFPAGTLCDFHYQAATTVTGSRPSPLTAKSR